MMTISSVASAQTFEDKLRAVQSIVSHDPDLEGSVKTPEFTNAVCGLSASELIRFIEAIGRPCGSASNINIYKTWLAGPGSDPDSNAAIWFNLGTEYNAFGDAKNKVACFKNCLAIRPGFYQAAVNLGLTYEAAKMQELAMATWRAALQPDDARVALLNNLGRAFEDLRQYKEAKKNFVTSLQTVADQRSVLHHMIGLRTKTCEWPIFGLQIPGVSHSAMMAATRALTLLALVDDIGLQCEGNRSWIEERMPAVPVPLSGPRRNGEGRIRIGYLSTDFCMHPIAYLIAELLEKHDRSRFEVFGYCATKSDNSGVRQRIVAAFDVYRSIIALSDEQAAAQIRDDRIDVLIDLNGLTAGTRLQILRSRPAPVQMTYLGYNGPIPLPELDYIIADRYVVPDDQAVRYSPKPLYMDRCFQVNDSCLPIEKSLTRADAGLPEAAFVFCCFSNTYKITEGIFAAWLTILARTNETVLWIYVDNDDAKENMRSVAQRRGIGSDRLIYATRVEASLYRGRLALADLFLDTFPYNAGTTASDALRVGLPLITISGQSFISRMAGSLLTAMALQECIVSSIDDYVELAVKLATESETYAALRAKVRPEIWDVTLGDTAGFCAELETKLEALVAGMGWGLSRRPQA